MNMTPSQMFRLIQEVMDEADVWKTCLNCKHFVEDTELCTLSVPPARPPARIITFACSAFVGVDYDEIKVRPNSIPAPRVNKFEVFDDDIPF